MNLENSTLSEQEKSLRVLTFYLNQQVFALPVEEIGEVNRVGRIRSIPGTPTSVLGLINLHGKAVPLINLKKQIGIEPDELPPQCKWIAVGKNGSAACIAVDKLFRFFRFSTESLDTIPACALHNGTKYVKYSVQIDSEILPVLDIQTIVSDQFVNDMSEAIQNP